MASVDSQGVFRARASTEYGNYRPWDAARCALLSLSCSKLCHRWAVVKFATGGVLALKDLA